jgi:hypothetical protein
VQFQCFAKVGERLVFCVALTRHIERQALGDDPITFPPGCRGKRTFYDSTSRSLAGAWSPLGDRSRARRDRSAFGGTYRL